MRNNYILKNGTILTMNENHEIFENYDILIQNNKIIKIAQEIVKEGSEIFDCSGLVIMPGLINTHTHVAMSYMKGLADDLDLHTWLTEHIWPVEQKMLDFEFVYNSSKHGVCEMIQNGITCFNDMYFYENATAKACNEIGIRAILGEGVVDFPMALHTGADSVLSFIRELHDEYKDCDLIDIAVAPHAVYTVGKESWKKSLALAKELDLLLHFHLSETEKENADFYEKNKISPTEMLNEIELLNHKSVAAHGVFLSDKDLAILGRSKTSIAVCTDSNLKLASGFAPINNYEKSGINWSIATDGVSSNNNLDLLEEASTTAKLHKALNHDPKFLDAEKMLRHCTIQAAKALHLDHEIGSIEVGKLADMIFIDLNQIQTQPLYNYYSQILYAMNSQQIKHVIINGKWIMRDKKFETVDENEVLKIANRYRKRLQ
jgi:5-methylthioadenosine/S-adenosylhomocysteine deaminase